MEIFKKYWWVSIPVILLYAFIAYRGLAIQNNEVKKQFAQIDVQLQRRADLVPNLVSTVKGYAAHEKDTFTAVTEARAKVGQINIDQNNLTPEKLSEYFAAQNQLTQALSKLMMVRESYSQLKANEGFLKLQDSLEGTENRISVARQRYNKAVETFNGAIRVFPANLTNSLLLHLEKKEYFKADEAAKAVPSVKF